MHPHAYCIAHKSLGICERCRLAAALPPGFNLITPWDNCEIGRDNGDFHHGRHDRNAMKSILLLCFCATMFGCAERDSVDQRNFAIDTCFPTQNEIQLAEGRTKSYWAKHASSFGPKPRLLAVKTSRPFPDEIQDLYPKLIDSETTAGFFGQGGSYSEIDLHGIMTVSYTHLTLPTICSV